LFNFFIKIIKQKSGFWGSLNQSIHINPTLKQQRKKVKASGSAG
jgi:hypothetical protein